MVLPVCLRGFGVYVCSPSTCLTSLPCVQGVYLEPSPILTGEGSTQANFVGQPFMHSHSDEFNLGGIDGKTPANILSPGIY